MKFKTILLCLFLSSFYLTALANNSASYSCSGIDQAGNQRTYTVVVSLHDTSKKGFDFSVVSNLNGNAPTGSIAVVSSPLVCNKSQSQQGIAIKATDSSYDPFLSLSDVTLMVKSNQNGQILNEYVWQWVGCIGNHCYGLGDPQQSSQYNQKDNSGHYQLTLGVGFKIPRYSITPVE